METTLQITPLENTVMNKLLAGNHIVLSTLRDQFSVASVCERIFTGVGFFTSFFVPEEAPLLTKPSDTEIYDVDAHVKGLKYGAGFILFVRDGKIDTLECCIYEEKWPDDAELIRAYYLVPKWPGSKQLIESPGRDLSELRDKWKT